MMPEIAEMSSIKIGNAGPINIIIVIPAYNEARFIGSVVLQASEFGTVIVVDDGSLDHTALIAANAGATVLRHEVNLGKSEAINTGFDYAKTLKADVFVMMDGDGQHLCGEIPTVIAPIFKRRSGYRRWFTVFAGEKPHPEMAGFWSACTHHGDQPEFGLSSDRFAERISCFFSAGGRQP
jgi:glycosyltransferase involved in cell wall biosynthesis